MPRPTKGLDARVHQARLKITQTEADLLTAEHGSVGKGLRVLLDLWTGTSPQPVRSEPEVSQPVQRVASGRHLHRPLTLVRTDFERGAKVQTWACECGQEMPR